jgi:hypothetical protein
MNYYNYKQLPDNAHILHYGELPNNMKSMEYLVLTQMADNTPLHTKYLLERCFMRKIALNYMAGEKKFMMSMK